MRTGLAPLPGNCPKRPDLIRPQLFAVIEGKLGLLVASRIEARPEVAQALLPQLEAQLATTRRWLEQRLADPAWVKGLGAVAQRIRAADEAARIPQARGASAIQWLPNAAVSSARGGGRC